MDTGLDCQQQELTLAGGVTIKTPTIPIKNAIVEAWKRVPHAPSLSVVLAFIDVESGFNSSASAKAAGASAAGLFQFTHSTWDEMIARYGQSYGIAEADVYDPEANAVMGILRIKLYAECLRHADIVSTPGHLYCLHFLGLGGGVKLIHRANEHPGYTGCSQWAAKQLFPIAAQANPRIFENQTVKQLYIQLTTRIDQLTAAYAAVYPDPPVAVPPTV